MNHYVDGAIECGLWAQQVRSVTDDAYIEGRSYGVDTIPILHQYMIYCLGMNNVQNQD